MKIPSFRLRVALLSSLLAGSALIGFGALSWFQIYNAQIGKLDVELFNQLMRATSPPPPNREPQNQERWQRYETMLSNGFGTNKKIPVALLVLDVNGNLIYQSKSYTDTDLNNLLINRLQLAPLPPPPPPPTIRRDLINPRDAINPVSTPPRPNTSLFVTQYTKKEAWRIGAAKFPNAAVAIAVSLEAVNQEMITIRNIFLVSIPGVLFLVAVGAWLISGSVLNPIRQLTSVIQNVTVKGLDKRIPVGTTDVEFVELIQVFNQMLERLERSFTQASRFSGDAAHELKTPLTILQGELERTLQQVEPGSEVQQRLSNLLDEVRRLSSIMRKLLLLSLADAGQMSLYLVEVDMSELLTEMVEDVELLAPHLSVSTNISNGLQVKGDRDLLIQVLQNLFSNAIKYNLANGWIHIHAYKTQTIHVTITNASINILKSERARIFERFHRGDPARNRKVEGTGLGLSLSREIVRAHHGDLTLDPIKDGQTGFTLTLPLIKN